MTAPILITNPTFGEILNQAAAPLLQTLQRQRENQQRDQQLQMEQQRVALEQQRTASELASQDQQRQVQAFALKDKQEEAQAEVDANKALQRLNELGFNDANINKVLAETKNPRAIGLLRTRIGELGQSLQAPSQVARAGSEATTAANQATTTTIDAQNKAADQPVVAAKRAITARSLALAGQFLDNPNRPLPTNNITQGQAVAAAVLDVTGLVGDAFRDAAAGRSANAQSDMLTRQLAMQAQGNALQQIAKNHADAGDAAQFKKDVQAGRRESDDQVFDRVAKSVGFEDAAQLKQLTQDAYQRWMKARRLNDPLLLSADPRLHRFILGAGFKQLNQDQKNLLVDTAMEAVRTGRTATNALAMLGQAGFENPAPWVGVLNNMILALKKTK